MDGEDTPVVRDIVHAADFALSNNKRKRLKVLKLRKRLLRACGVVEPPELVEE